MTSRCGPAGSISPQLDSVAGWSCSRWIRRSAAIACFCAVDTGLDAEMLAKGKLPPEAGAPGRCTLDCIKTVSKPLVFVPLGLASSEKQMPQMIGNVGAERN